LHALSSTSVTQAPPEEVLAFPEVHARGTAGFLSFTVRSQDAAGDALEGVLHSLVFFADFIDAAMVTCKMIAKARMRARFATYQLTFERHRVAPPQL